MINVTLYNFNKRENSTKQPGRDSQQKTHQAALKDSCSLLHPRLVFDFGKLGNPSYYNYCYISDLGGKYYFIRDWEYERGFWTAYCDVDVLATWRNDIGISKQYILRSSATYDGDVIDNFYPAKQGATAQTITVTSPFSKTIPDGFYIVGIINDDENGIGAVHYYVFSQKQFNKLVNYLMSDIQWTSVTEITEELEKILFNPFQYIVSCVWVPFDPPVGGDLIAAIPYGWWTLDGVVCKRMSGTTPYGAFNRIAVTIPKHPQAAGRGAYLNGAPFSQYSLIFPAFGSMSLDSLYLAKSSTLYCTVHVDLATGQGRLELTDANSNVLRTEYTQFGVPIQLAQMGMNLGAHIKGWGGAITAAASGFAGNAFGFASGIMSTIGNALDMLKPQVEAQGTTGAFESFSQDIRLVAHFCTVVGEDNDDRGRPLCQKKEIYTIPGYILTLDSDINFAGTKEELQQVKQYMESGFFYE